MVNCQAILKTQHLFQIQQIIEKILYQHELYNHQRFMAQIDFGGVPFDKIMKNIELIGNEIIPGIKKYLKK